MISLPILISSDTTQGATNKSSNGDQFEVNLDRPIIIPKTARNLTVEVKTRTIWWNIANIVEGVNDKLFVNDGADFTLTIPPGLYSVTALNAAVSRALVLASKVSTLITFTADKASGKSVMTLNAIGLQVDFSVALTFRLLLGFDAVKKPTAATTLASTPINSDNIASFNAIDYFLLHSSLTNQGMRVNKTYSKVVARVLIDVPVGSQVKYRPVIPTQTNASNLKGAKISQMRFWLTDQANNSVNTNGENFTMEMVIRYN